MTIDDFPLADLVRDVMVECGKCQVCPRLSRCLSRY